jgi:hypothetical protein
LDNAIGRRAFRRKGPNKKRGPGIPVLLFSHRKQVRNRYPVTLLTDLPHFPATERKAAQQSSKGQQEEEGKQEQTSFWGEAAAAFDFRSSSSS